MKAKIYFIFSALFLVLSSSLISCTKESTSVSSVELNGNTTNGYIYNSETTKSGSIQFNKITLKSGDNVIGYLELVTTSTATSIAGTYQITDKPTSANQATLGYYDSYSVKGGCFIRQQSTKWYITSGTITVTYANGVASFVATGSTAVNNTDGSICSNVSMNLSSVQEKVNYNYTYTETITYPTTVPLLGTALPGIQRHKITVKKGATVMAYLEVLAAYGQATAVVNATYPVTTWNNATAIGQVMGGYSIPAYYLTGGSYITDGVKKFLTSGNITFTLGMSKTFSISGTGIGTMLSDGATTGTATIDLTYIGHE